MQVAAMQMGSRPPELSELIAELGRAYDPERLAAVLQDRWFEVNTRAARVAVSLGSFAARVAKVHVHHCCWPLCLHAPSLLC